MICGVLVTNSKCCKGIFNLLLHVFLYRLRKIRMRRDSSISTTSGWSELLINIYLFLSERGFSNKNMKRMTKLTFCVDKYVPLKMYWYNRNSTAALLVSKGLLSWGLSEKNLIQYKHNPFVVLQIWSAFCLDKWEMKWFLYSTVLLYLNVQSILFNMPKNSLPCRVEGFNQSLTNSVFSFLPKDTLVCRLTTKALLFAYLSTLGKGVPFIPLKFSF